MTPFQWTVDQTKILRRCLCECEFARQLSLPRRHFGVNRLLFPSMFAGDNATIENNEEALERAGASSVSFGCWIHLRNHLGGWLCLTEPRTDCDRSCCLALQGQTFPHWCSKITDKKQLGGLGGGGMNIQHTAHYNPGAGGKEWEPIVLCCSHLQALIQLHNVQITDSCFPLWSISKHCHRV